ncbi:hypothetical protein KCG44_02210 [Pacificimonas sp. WHA3]|uniref:Uncharacterized protein n=1 Tax=Pacificimonas pallii TaxID=2827236 RepID=A0ABS6SB07_9SPHN|nr:hypothetical protein [Pacificimonas pallii]MBV7255594.1 hypothetical protein [Pacificimonas pallii]
MILIIAERTDAPALWLQRRLSRPAAPVPVRRVNPAQLFAGSSFRFHIAGAEADTSVALSNGRAFDGAALTGVINRVGAVPLPLLTEIGEADREYAESELNACLLGWLAALPCPVLNMPTPGCLGGAWHTDLATCQLAARANLPMGHGAPAAHFVWLEGKIFPRLPDTDLRRAVDAFARGYGGRAVQVDMAADGLLGATPYVDYRIGGDALVRHVRDALMSDARRDAA